MAKIFDKNDSRDFLLTEYQECFEQMRHYDTVEINFLTFSFSGYLALIAASFALHQYLGASHDVPYVSIVLFAGSVIGIILLAFAVRNRAYFVVVARQVNSIRRYFLENSETDFIGHNKCYLDPLKPKNFNCQSTYAYLIYMLVFLNSALIFGATYFFIRHISLNAVNWCHFALCVLIFVVLAAAQLCGSINYLKKREKKKAD